MAIVTRQLKRDKPRHRAVAARRALDYPTAMFTVFGGNGFIGRALVRALRERGEVVNAVGRGDPIPAGELGHVIYAIGLTADFRTRLLDTVEAHVSALVRVLRTGGFESLLYLSSTRVYARAHRADEAALLPISPLDPSDLYNVSKLAGESTTLSHGEGVTRVARLSNVYGAGMQLNFLADVIREALASGRVVIRSPELAAKDYISISDVVDALISIAARGQARIYNVASGVSVTNGEIAALLAKHAGASVAFQSTSPALAFPPIEVARIRGEFGWSPRELKAEFDALVKSLALHAP